MRSPYVIVILGVKGLFKCMRKDPSRSVYVGIKSVVLSKIECGFLCKVKRDVGEFSVGRGKGGVMECYCKGNVAGTEISCLYS